MCVYNLRTDLFVGYLTSQTFLTSFVENIQYPLF